MDIFASAIKVKQRFQILHKVWQSIHRSRDHWTNFTTMETHARDARNYRLIAAPFTPFQDILYITSISDEIRNNFPNPTDLPQVFNHQNELAIPLACPGFAMRARCIRCQQLFNYRVPQAVIHQELGQQQGTNIVLNCAEVYGHFFCLAAGHWHIMVAR